MKFGNSSGLRWCSDNWSNISSFSSNHRYLSALQLKRSLSSSLFVCVSVCTWERPVFKWSTDVFHVQMTCWMPRWSLLHGLVNVHVGFIFFSWHNCFHVALRPRAVKHQPFLGTFPRVWLPEMWIGDWCCCNVINQLSAMCHLAYFLNKRYEKSTPCWLQPQWK